MVWHTLELEKVYKVLNGGETGLTDSEAEMRLKSRGYNLLKESKKKTAVSLFLDQYKNLMIIILMLAALISGIAGDLKDTIVISAIIFLNSTIGFIQEYRAEKAMEALNKITAQNCMVIRNGKEKKIPAKNIVPGDLVMLEAGDIIPADIRLIRSFNLQVDESSITGESVPVNKETLTIHDPEAQIADLTNMLFKSTIVTNGRAKGIVTATGMDTEIGKIAAIIQEEESPTPLQLRMNDFVKKLSVAILLISLVIFIAGLMRGESPLQMLLISISIAVAAIPEALPAVIVISLSLGAKRMLGKNALVRKLPAVEALGSVTVICTDKTGTITENKMTVREFFESGANGRKNDMPDNILLTSMLLNQNVHFDSDGRINGDPTEVALVSYAIEHVPDWKAIISKYKKIFEIPFDSDRKTMTTIHGYDERFLVITKGAPEEIIEKCNIQNKGEIVHRVNELAGKGFRVISFGYKICKEIIYEKDTSLYESDLTFAGYCGMIDPPRAEVKQSVKKCHESGIIPVMITGDNPLTARSIATGVGIINDNDQIVMTGKELKMLDDREYKEKIERIRVYARVSPSQKLEIVTALQEKGHFVAMTGDGVNDAPAIKKANIGISMGKTGTDVSKEVSQIILVDDNFSTILNAVVEGRKIFDNIRKFVRYILSGNFAEIITIFSAPLLGLPLPLIPIQILWINLMTDGLPGLAFSSEREEIDILKRPPREPSKGIFSEGLGFQIVWSGILIAFVCLSLQAWAVYSGNEHWQTLIFTALCFCQLGNAFSIRSENNFIYKQGIFSNLTFILSVAITVALHLSILYVPFFAKIFEVHPLTFFELSLTILSGILVFHILELQKLIKSKLAFKR